MRNEEVKEMLYKAKELGINLQVALYKHEHFEGSRSFTCSTCKEEFGCETCYFDHLDSFHKEISSIIKGGALRITAPIKFREPRQSKTTVKKPQHVPSIKQRLSSMSTAQLLELKSALQRKEEKYMKDS